jgi:hypothetical protein
MLTLTELCEELNLLKMSLTRELSLSGAEVESISIGLTPRGLTITLGGVIVFIEKRYFDASKSKDMTARLQEIAPGYFVCQGLSTKSTSDQLSLLDGMIANEPQDTSRK